MNQVLLIGTIHELPEKAEDKSLSMSLKVMVERPFKSSEGESISDIFTVELWRGVSESIRENYSMGNVVAVKGRLELAGCCNKIIAERISLISTVAK